VWNKKDQYLGWTNFKIGDLIGSKFNSLELEIFGGSIGIDKDLYEHES
jgi:hypothetical protein